MTDASAPERKRALVAAAKGSTAYIPPLIKLAQRKSPRNDQIWLLAATVYNHLLCTRPTVYLFTSLPRRGVDWVLHFTEPLVTSIRHLMAVPRHRWDCDGSILNFCILKT